MSLLNTYANKSNAELVEILEQEDGYTKDAVYAAKTILEFRNIEEEEVKNCAKVFWEFYLKDNIKQHLFVKKKPKSYFLSNKEMTILFKRAFKDWQEKQNLFEIDTTKYWFV